MRQNGKDGGLQRVVCEVRTLLAQYGAGVFESRGQTASYLRRRFPQQQPDVDACLHVLYLPRYLECLTWRESAPQTDALAAQYWSYFDSLLKSESGSALARDANRLLILG